MKVWISARDGYSNVAPSAFGGCMFNNLPLGGAARHVHTELVIVIFFGFSSSNLTKQTNICQTYRTK